MNEIQLMFQERHNTGTAWTRNDSFEKNGYLVVKDLWEVDELYYPLPEQRGQLNYWDKNPEHFHHTEVEQQVEGSLARYWHPQYRTIHTGIRLKLEEIIGRKLYNTYYYDRYYFPGQELTKHADRDACEISVSVHISTNLEGKDADWPLVCEGEDLNEYKLELEPGKSLYYNGSRYKHGRPTKYTGKEYLNFYVHYKIKETKVIPIKPKNNSHIKMI